MLMKKITDSIKKNNPACTDGLINLLKFELKRDSLNKKVYVECFNRLKEQMEKQKNIPLSNEMILYCDYSKITLDEFYNSNCLDGLICDNIEEEINNHLSTVLNLPISVEYKKDYLRLFLTHYIGIYPNILVQNLPSLAKFEKKVKFNNVLKQIQTCYAFSIFVTIFFSLTSLISLLETFIALSVLTTIIFFIGFILTTEPRITIKNILLLFATLFFGCLTIFSLIAKPTSNLEIVQEIIPFSNTTNIVKTNYRSYFSEDKFEYGLNDIVTKGNPFIAYN